MPKLVDLKKENAPIGEKLERVEFHKENSRIDRVVLYFSNNKSIEAKSSNEYSSVKIFVPEAETKEVFVVSGTNNKIDLSLQRVFEEEEEAKKYIESLEQAEGWEELKMTKTKTLVQD